MEEELATILAAIEENKEELIEFCREIVRIPSYSGQEEAVAKVIARWMHEFEFDNVMTDELGSVIGDVEGKTGSGKLLLFDSHMDHVAIGRRDTWGNIEPFGAIIKDNAIYGRGVVDMKGALASQIFAMGIMRRYGIVPPVDVYMAVVVHEELQEGMAIKHIIEKVGIKPDCIILGEATHLNLSIGQRGRAEIEVITKGETSHASMPELGKNAVYSMAKIINEIKKVNETLPTDSRLGKGSITIINISSSPEQGNIVPDKCRIVVDRRTITGETEEGVLNELNEILNSLRKKIPDFDADLKILDEKLDCYTGKTLFNHKYFPAWNLDPSTPIVQKAKSILESALESEVKITKWLFSTDGVYTAGVANISTLGFGPGDENQAHSPNERLEIDQLIQSAKGYAALALRLLSD